MSWQRGLCTREVKLRVAMFLKRLKGLKQLGALSGRTVWEGRPKLEVALFGRISKTMTLRLLMSSRGISESCTAWAYEGAIA